MSIRALINAVLEEVAIDGEAGTTIERLFGYVNDFYINNRQERREFSKLDPSGEDAQEPNYWGVPNVKEDFQEYIWDILKQEKDFIIGPQNEDASLTLKEVVEKKLHTGGPGVEQLRVYSTEERRWRVLTGHGPDPKKLPNAVFKCLEEIGKHRRKGLIQPELTRLTGQDKRSIAARTSLLAKYGYIEKVGVLAKTTNTSKLTLMKFAIQRDLMKKAEVSKQGDNRKAARRETWNGEVIHIADLVKALLKELKSCETKVLLRNELKTRLGMDQSKFHRRTLSRIFRRVESMGIWKRIRVPVGSRSYLKIGVRATGKHHVRCVKFLRDPTDEEWKIISASSKAYVTMDDEDEGEEEAESDVEQAKDNEEDDAEASKELAKLGAGQVEEVEEVLHELPRWNVCVPVVNMIFELISAAGTEGMSSMDILSKTVGNFYYRPMDQILHRLTDFPEKSQPPEYVHLAIIRETSISKRQTHYRYFSYSAHQELVKEGLATAPWASKPKAKGTKTLSTIDSANPFQIELNEDGFPAVNTSRLLKKNGTATLSDAQKDGKRKENAVPYTSEFVIITNPDGTKSMDWNQSNRSCGRPRKYEKGKEPYLSAKRRREGADGNGEPPPKRGRPRKTDNNGNKIPGKPRGRPRKNAAAIKKAAEPAPIPVDSSQPSQPKDDIQPAVSQELEPVARAVDLIELTPVKPTLPVKGRKRKEKDVQPSETPTKETPTRAMRASKRKASKEPTETPQGKRTRATRGATASVPTPSSSPAGKKGKRVRFTQTQLQFTPVNRTLPNSQDEQMEVKTQPDEPPQATPNVATPVVEDTTSGEIAQVSSSEADKAVPLEELPSNQGDNPLTNQEEACAAESTAQSNITSHEIDGTLLEIEPPEANSRSYNSMGGMLALERQKIILDLVAENGGAFPGGMEIRHAFNQRYQKTNPKAGIADRRLVRGIVQSLQQKGKVNQITFTFMSTKNVMCTKKLLVDTKLSLDAPVVTMMTKELIKADGNMWFPPGTDIADDVKDRISHPGYFRTAIQNMEVEAIGFDRLYTNEAQKSKLKRDEKSLIRAQRKAEKDEERRRKYQERVARGEAVEILDGRFFTEEQWSEARARRAALLKSQSALYKLNKRYGGELAPQEGKPRENVPKKVWWDDFVDRTDGSNFKEGVKAVQEWEQLMLEVGQGEFPQPQGEGSLLMVNHFGPNIEAGENFSQAQAELDQQIELGNQSMNFSRPRPKRKRRLKSGETEATPTPTVDGEAPAEVQPKRRSGRSKRNGPTRRELAMAAIHNNSLEVAGDQEHMATRKESLHRNSYAIPKADEDTLLIAVIIIRTVFGGLERKINWGLVQKALPQHPVSVCRGRWPRVRDMNKKHLKRLHSEFEDMYLEAYAKDELPPVNLNDPSTFDVVLHVKWFQKSLKMPESNAVPELPRTRETFDNLYDLRPEHSPPWRSHYHDTATTMWNRANHFICHAFELPVAQKEVERRPGVEYAKSLIKSNIITDATVYNPRHAFDMLHALEEDDVDEAFFDLNVEKVVVHRKEHRSAAPGRNYELADKFHLSLKTPMDEKLFAQAVKFYRRIGERFEEGEDITVSPFVNDGTVAGIFDMVSHGRLRLERQNFNVRMMGLIDGYETRSMRKDLIDFDVVLKPGPRYDQRRELPPLQPVPGANRQEMEPIPIWYDIEGNLVKGMWLRVATAVLSIATTRPGATVSDIAAALNPGITRGEAELVVKWLVERGALKEGDSRGIWNALRVQEGYYLALEGL